MTLLIENKDAKSIKVALSRNLSLSTRSGDMTTSNDLIKLVLCKGILKGTKSDKDFQVTI